MNSEQIKEEIRAKLGDYLISRGVNIKNNFKCLTGIHKDNNPSMKFYPDTNKVYCFACGNKTYDIFDLIGFEYNLTNFNDQYKKACELYGYTPYIEKSKKGTKPAQATSPAPTTQPTQVTQHTQPTEEEERVNYKAYYDSLPLATSENCTYLQGRGISDKLIKRFNIKYDSQHKALGGKPAVVIPLDNYSYYARNTDKNASKIDKHRFNKGDKAIFNADALKGNKPIFVTEGQINSLSIMESIEGVAEAIAIGGANSHGKFLEILKTFRGKLLYPLILNFDTDETGFKALDSLSEKLTQEGIPHICDFVQGDLNDINDALLAEPERLKENCLRAVAECKKVAYTQAGLVSASSCVNDFKKMIKDNVSTINIPTGFKTLDESLSGGLYEGLYTIGAISSLGKTTFCLQIADNIAKSGRDVLIFSLEMSKYELMAKSISRETHLRTNITGWAKTARKIMSYHEYANFSQNELNLIEEATNAYEDFSKHLYIYEGIGDLGVKQVANKLETLYRFHSLDSEEGYKPVVLIDYLQILAPYDTKLTDKQNIDKNILELKRLSRDYKIPIILISSLNRESYKDGKKARDISMVDFKESGAIEYSSDVLLGLQLKLDNGESVEDNKAKTNREIELLVLKNRSGAIGAKIHYVYNTLFNYYKELDF